MRGGWAALVLFLASLDAAPVARQRQPRSVRDEYAVEIGVENELGDDDGRDPSVGPMSHQRFDG